MVAARQWIGGERTCMPRYVVGASIVNRGVDDEAKAGFVKEVTREVDQLTGEVWVLFDEARRRQLGRRRRDHPAASQAILGGS